jgi:hypothetical protein
MSAPRKLSSAAKKMAAMEFEPWSPESIQGLMEELSNPRYRKDMDRIGIDLRLAAGTLAQSKADLVQGFSTLGNDVFEITDSLDDTAKRLHQLANYVEDASDRLMIAITFAALSTGGIAGD